MAMRANDMRGGAIASTFFMAVAAGCAIWIYMATNSIPEPQRIAPLLLSVFAGGYAGWFHLSRKLGRGHLISGVFGVGAGIIAFTILAAVIGLQRAYAYQMSVQFEDATEAVIYALNAMFGVFAQAMEAQAAVLILVACSFAAGMFSEAFNRIWR